MPEPWRNRVSAGATRAQRFAIQVPIRYRAGAGPIDWYEGTMENISCSGVLFRTESVLEPNTAIEMRFVLPAEISGEAAAEVICLGVIIRRAPASGANPMPALGAKILDYRFSREQEASRA